MRVRFVALAGLLSLSCAACHQTEAGSAHTADLTQLCGAPDTLAALKSALLPPGKGRRYMARLKTASVDISEAHSTGQDEQGAQCAATAQLVSPLAKDDPRSTQNITYAVQAEGAGAPRLMDLRAAGDGSVQSFAELLRHPKLAEVPPAPTTATVQTAAMDAPSSTGPVTPAPSLSEETQSLVDQAGDTRSMHSDDAPPLPAAAPNSALNSIAGTY